MARFFVSRFTVALLKSMDTVLTEKEVKSTLDIKGFPGKWNKALEHAKGCNDEQMFWTNARQAFLELGGQFKWQ